MLLALTMFLALARCLVTAAGICACMNEEDLMKTQPEGYIDWEAAAKALVHYLQKLAEDKVGGTGPISAKCSLV